MKVTIGNKQYELLIGYQKDNVYRAAFNNLSVKTFGLSFEEWYDSGYWREKYIPYTLFDGDKAIANVSVNIMDFNTFGEQKRYIQIGTVMTDENYRNQGLNRFLFEKILADWDKKCDFVYLFANSTVLDFYPKFGFFRYKEYECSKSITHHSGINDFQKLTMDDQLNRDKLYDYAKNSVAFSHLSMNENADLVLFYCITVFKDYVYYIQSLDTIVITQLNDQTLHLLAVFSKKQLELDSVIDSLTKLTINRIILGFTPKNPSSYEINEIGGDDILFIQAGKTQLFDENKMMFPRLSHA